MKRVIVIILTCMVYVQFAEANPWLLRAAGSKVVRKKAGHTVIEVMRNGKTYLRRLKDGKRKRTHFNFSDIIKMPKADKKSGTKHGFLRDKNYFWKNYAKKFPNNLSPKNRIRIKKNRSPVVDRTWMQKHRDHKPFNGQKLEHHHLKGGAFAIPLPRGLHRGKVNNRFFHH